MEGRCLKLPRGRAEGLVTWSKRRSFLCLVEGCEWSVMIPSEQPAPENPLLPAPFAPQAKPGT